MTTMLDSRIEPSTRIGPLRTKVLERSLFREVALRMQTVVDQDDRIVMVKSFQVEGLTITHRSTFCAECAELCRDTPE